MFASVEYQHRSARSPHVAADVFERASLCILRRYQRGAARAESTGADGSLAVPIPGARQRVPDDTGPHRGARPPSG
jgi:hypothetical protein